MDGNAYLRWMLKRSSWNRLATALLQHARLKGVAGWAQTFRRYTRRTEEDGTGVALPQWLDRDFVDRTHLAERIGTLGLVGETNHPWHPYAMACFTGPLWQRHFGDFDFQESLAPVVWRHPYFDLRVLRFMLSVPPVPWGWKKHLLREAMRGRLPDEVLAREKTSLPYAPDLASIRATGLPAFSGTGALAQYVDVSRLPSGAVSDYELRCTVAAQALDYWLSGDNPQPGPPR
jgi:asparagine synthase (glutamine-hydrolysing)